ncbi:YaiI/YqxD family protein [Aliidiomarina sedimenti]|uniref:UPF0178 protein CWE12_10830 n=1 Tax=Aliidiomarina sedimenti TaxID=1933879 RepID=A0ABY0BWT4_9GAMM|nr:YaiI/YqxD family protein [Aliidiomarina sedimenti]RUO28799.1 YaiI/YqxD family protein [Aliidiomarina sedimenti]
MTIWVDADACPRVIKDILFRAAVRKQLPLILVANHYQATPKTPLIKSIQVAGGFDEADDEIVRRCEPGDLVITADIPLASEVIAKKGQVITPRGEILDSGNVGARLNIRDFNDTMRASGEHTGGPPPLHARDRQQFANALDRYLAQNS